MLVLLFVSLLHGLSGIKQEQKAHASVRFASNLPFFLVLAFMVGIWLFLPLRKRQRFKEARFRAKQLMNNIQHNELWSSDILSFFMPSYYNGILQLANRWNILKIICTTRRLSAWPTYPSLYCSCDLFSHKQQKTGCAVDCRRVVFGLLSLGPWIEFDGIVLHNSLPVLSVPSYTVHQRIKEPGRFNLMTTMFFAILASIGVKLLLEKGSTHKKLLLHNKLLVLGVISFLFLIESNGMPLGSSLAQQVATHVSVPNFYTLLSTLPRNFSVIQLPAEEGVYTTLSVGKATYYTSITQKPLVGGYVTRGNETDLLSLYNIPLVLQDENLISHGNMSYSSPVVENYTNQTLLALFNYNTEFVIVDKTAYNNASLTKIAGYLANVFGAPVYNDNTTLAFLTVNAISQSVFKSFVSYPILTQWQTTLIPFNGTYRNAWVPFQSGAIVVYAPYSNATGAGSTTSPSNYINTTIRFSAISSSPQMMYVAEQEGDSIKTIALLNMTNTLQSYVVDVTLASGPVGNTLFFITSNKNLTAAILGITFSRRTS